MIKQERILFLREILISQMNHLTLFPVVLTIYTMIKLLFKQECGNVLFWLPLGLIPLFFYIVRRRVTKFVPFVLLHASVLVILFAVPLEDMLVKFLCMAGGTGYAIYSFYLKIKDEGTLSDRGCSAPVLVGIPAALLFLQHVQKAHQWDSYYYIPLIISLGLFFLVHYISKYLNFLVVNESSASHIPAREIFRSGMGLALGYTLFGVLVLTLTSHLEWLAAAWNAVKRGFTAILRFLLGLIPDSSASQEIIREEAAQGQQGMPEQLLPAGKSGLFWVILEYIAEGAVIIGITAAIIWGLVKLGRWLSFIVRNRFGQTAGEKNLYQSSQTDVREKCTLAKNTEFSGTRAKELFGFLQPGERIRNLYRKRLLELHKYTPEDQLNNSTTPRECISMLGSEEPVLLYEKARYSNQECTAEDVRSMRRNLNRR